MEQSDFSFLIWGQRIDIMLPLAIVKLYFRNYLLLLHLLPWVLVFQLLRVLDEMGSDRIKGLDDIQLPVKVSARLVTSGCVGHLEGGLVNLIELSVVGLGI